MSTRAMINSDWDPISADSSRRSSMTSNHGGHGGAAASAQAPGIGSHLSRLHRKANQQQTNMMHSTPTATPTPTMGATAMPMDMQQQPSSGRGSGMSSMATPTNNFPPMNHPGGGAYAIGPQAQGGGGGVRRASDPVRPLDRNFGVHGGGAGGVAGGHQQPNHNNMGRRGSYNHQMASVQHNQRVPMHGQRIRGMSGDTFFNQGSMVSSISV